MKDKVDRPSEWRYIKNGVGRMEHVKKLHMGEERVE
jgi:hypothetical protein